MWERPGELDPGLYQPPEKESEKSFDKRHSAAATLTLWDFQDVAPFRASGTATAGHYCLMTLL